MDVLVETSGRRFGLRAPAFNGMQVQGGTAQWIVERPCNPNAEPHRQLFELPRFRAMRFAKCVAELGPLPGAAARPAERISLHRASLLRMNQRTDNPNCPIIALAVPRLCRRTDGLLVEQRWRQAAA